MKKKTTQLCHLQEIHFKCSNVGRLKFKDWGKKYHPSINQNNVGVAILISVETDFRAKKFTRHRETLRIEKTVNLPRRVTCIHHHRAVKHKAEIYRMKGGTDKSTITIKDFKIPL